MERGITLHLDENTDERLTELAGLLGYSREMAAVYALRLVSACVREGLIRDVPACAWPGEAKPLCDTQNRVLTLPHTKKSAKTGAERA
ncbi:MAG: hypothetical protein IJB85_05685 [Clostridia bacterium]|nr:hypothetical protein [Clostridia bacterium]